MTNGGYSWARWNRGHHLDIYSNSNFTGGRDFFLNYYSGAAVKLANQVVVTSDDRIKTNEKYIENAIQTLMKLKPQTYTKGPNLGEVVDDSGNVTKAEPISRTESGLIAQDVWYDAPELRHLISHSEDAVIPDEKPYVDDDPTKDPDYSTWGGMSAGIGYEGLIAYLIKAIQELNTEGDIEWMEKAAKQEVGFEAVEEMVDATGNEIKIKRKKNLNAKDKKKKMKQIKQKIADGEDLDSEEEGYAVEWNL